MKKLALFLFIFSFCGVMTAAALPCRSGWVLQAEISTRAVNIRNFQPALYAYLPPQKAYCAVTLILAEGRKLSMADYNLEHFGRRLPCVAIAQGNGAFEALDYTIAPRKNQKCTLLFILDATRVTQQSTVELLLCSTAHPDRIYETKFLAPVIGARNFTSSSAIPLTGKFPQPKRQN